MSLDGQLPPKMRLLRAAAELLANSAGAPVSTRQITQLAGVSAPTLYHHFGDKEGLFDAVVAAGFEEYVAGERDFAPSDSRLRTSGECGTTMSSSDSTSPSCTW